MGAQVTGAHSLGLKVLALLLKLGKSSHARLNSLPDKNDDSQLLLQLCERWSGDSASAQSLKAQSPD